jgi:hypothetical protein
LLLNELPDPTFRQSVRDFMVNQQFRRDYWIKGRRELTPLDCIEADARTARGAVHAPRRGAAHTGQSTGLDLPEPAHLPALAGPAGGLPSAHAGEIEQELRQQDIRLGQVHQAAMVLMHKGALGLAQDDDTIARCRPRAPIA